MKVLITIFWIIFLLFVYKLSFLEQDIILTSHQITIVRDSEGVPHIYARNNKDMLFGLGYAQAQDRMFSLYIKKMFIEGRLSEVFGREGVLSDLQMRNIGFMEMAKNNKLHTDQETLQLLQAYADGINQYARTTKMLPFQFYLFWKDWDQWIVEDTLAQINFLSFMLQFDWFYQMARQRLLETVGFQVGIKAISYGGKNIFRNTTIIDDEQLKKLGLYEQYDFESQKEILKKHWKENNVSIGSINIHKPSFNIEGSGSNAWVIGGQHTQNGKPLLANDPHVGSLMPTLFYGVQLILLTEDNKVRQRKFGVIPDGVTSLSIGVSDDMAWGTTAAYIDNKDVYFETIRNQSGKMQYLFKDEWKDFRERKQLIKVRFGQDIQQIYYHTHRGVVLEQIYMDVHWKYGFPLHDKYKQNHTLTLVAAHFKPDNQSAKGHMRTLIFQNFEEFDQVSNLINYPNVDNIFILDNGTFGYKTTGAIPKRNIPQMGSFIKNGNTDIYDMGQNLSPSQKITLNNPEKGYIAMCNNRFASDHYKFRSSLHQIVTGRAFRLQKIITQKLQKQQKFNFQDMKLMQLDQKDQYIAEILLPFLQKLNEFKKIWQNEQTQQIYSRLAKWDCVLHKQSIEASLYSVWQHLFQQSLFKLVDLNQEQIQAIVNHGFFQNYQFILFQKFINGQFDQQQKPVCQTIQTKKYPQLHPCQVSIALAFKNLPQELKKLFSSDNIQDYKWGVIHNQQYKIVPFGQIPLLRKIWQRNFPVGGNSRTLFVALYSYQSETFNSLGSPSFRIITDLNRTQYSLQLGQSDRIFSSKFYDNFLNKQTYVTYVKINPYEEALPQGWRMTLNTLQ